MWARGADVYVYVYVYMDGVLLRGVAAGYRWDDERNAHIGCDAVLGRCGRVVRTCTCTWTWTVCVLARGGVRACAGLKHVRAGLRGCVGVACVLARGQNMSVRAAHGPARGA